MSGTAPAWRQFVMNLDTLEPGVVEEVFTRFGAQSISFSDAADNPVLEPGPGETPLWADTQISGLFSPDVDIQQRDCRLHQEIFQHAAFQAGGTDIHYLEKRLGLV